MTSPSSSGGGVPSGWSSSLAAGSGLPTSISTNMPLPVGVGQLAIAVAQAKTNATLVARRKERRRRAKQAALLPGLLREVLPGPPREARAAHATPAFGTDEHTHANDITDLLTKRTACGHHLRSPRGVGVIRDGGELDFSDGGENEEGDDDLADPEANEVRLINEEKEDGSGAAPTVAIQPVAPAGNGPSGGAAAVSPARRNASLVSAGLTTSIAQTFRVRARQKSLAVKAHAWGIHGSTSSKLVGPTALGKGLAANAFLRARAASHSGPSGGHGERLSLSSLLSRAPHAQLRASKSGQYALSEEERKISAYYAHIQSAAARVADSIDALLPHEDDDVELLTLRWTQQGLSADEIALRLAQRGAISEHDEYRTSLKQVADLLDGLSAAAIGTGARAHSASADSTADLESHAAAAAAAEAAEEAAERAELERARDEEEARLARETREREEDEALDRADAEANVAAGGGATPTDGSIRSPVDDDDLSNDSAEEEELARTLQIERAAGAPPTPPPTEPKPTIVTAATTSTFDPSSPTALPLPAAAAAASRTAAAAAANPAAVYRDLYNFFVGKRRNEVIDSKRLHVLETQAAAVEEGSETSRQAIHESMRVQDAHTSRILHAYHQELKEVSAQFGPDFLAHLDATVRRAEQSRAAQSDAAARGAAPTSHEDAESDRMKLELLAATLQARVAEQDELLASVGVETIDESADEEDVTVAAALASTNTTIPAPPKVRYTYTPVVGRSFESKTSRLASILRALDATLLARQDERFTVQTNTEKVSERIARLLHFANAAAMQAQEREEARAKEESLRARHASVVAEIRSHTSEAEAAYQAAAQQNHVAALSIKAIETELAGLHSMREHDAQRIRMLRSKHQRECLAITRGQIPKHLLGLLQQDGAHGGANHGALSQDPLTDADAMAFSSSRQIGTEFVDPELDVRQFALKDADVADLGAFDDDDDDARDPKTGLTLAEAAAAAEAAAEESRRQFEAAEAEADARATTPVSQLRRRMDKVWFTLASQEMAYIPWQAELYNTLQPTFRDLVHDIAALKDRLANKRDHRDRWEERQARLKAEEEAEESDDEAERATLAMRRATRTRDGDDVSEEDANTTAGEEEEEEEEDEGSDAPDIRNAATISGVRPRQYPREVKTRSYLSGGIVPPAQPQEDAELTAARLKHLGTNSYINDRIAAFHTRRGAPTNAAYKGHMDMLRQDLARLRVRMQALMNEWDALHKLDQANAAMETQAIAPTRRRVETVRAHVERVSRAIADKASWTAAREAAAEAEARALEEAEREAEQGEEGEQPADLDATVTSPKEQSTEDTEQTDAVQPPPTSSTAAPAVLPPTVPATKSRRPSVAPDRAVARSRRPSVAPRSMARAPSLTRSSLAAPTATTADAAATSPSNASARSRSMSVMARSSSALLKPASDGTSGGLAHSASTGKLRKATANTTAAAATAVLPSTGASDAIAVADVPVLPSMAHAGSEVELAASNAALEAETALLEAELARLERELAQTSAAAPATVEAAGGDSATATNATRIIVTGVSGDDSHVPSHPPTTTAAADATMASPRTHKLQRQARAT